MWKHQDALFSQSINFLAIQFKRMVSQSLSYTLVGSKQSQLFIGPFFKHYVAIFIKEKLIFLQFKAYNL